MPRIQSKKTIGVKHHRRSAAKRLTFAAAACALAFTVTLFLNVPAAFLLGAGGNINLGDAVLLLASGLFGMTGAVAAAAGAALADIAGGYAVYAPATIVIKAVAGILFALMLRIGAALNDPGSRRTAFFKALGVVLYLFVLLLGYFFAEAALLRIAGTATNAAYLAAARTLLPNLLQALAAALVAMPLLANDKLKFKI